MPQRLLWNLMIVQARIIGERLFSLLRYKMRCGQYVSNVAIKTPYHAIRLWVSRRR